MLTPPAPCARLVKPASHGLGAFVWRVDTPAGPQAWKDYSRLAGTWKAPLARLLVRREARALAAMPAGAAPRPCSHPNALILAMEWVDGRPLRAGDGDLALGLLPVIEAMRHCGIAHNDLHRSNVMATGGRVVLLDLGAATVFSPAWRWAGLSWLSRRDRTHVLRLAARYGAPIPMPPRHWAVRALQLAWATLYGPWRDRSGHQRSDTHPQRD